MTIFSHGGEGGKIHAKGYDYDFHRNIEQYNLFF